jgi:hypothetical protein
MNKLENFVEKILVSMQFYAMPFSCWWDCPIAFQSLSDVNKYVGQINAYKYSGDLPSKNILLKNVPFKSFSDQKGSTREVSWTEFVAISQKYPRGVRIECKSQKSYGSAQEKLKGLIRDLSVVAEEKVVVVHDFSDAVKDGTLAVLRWDAESFNQLAGYMRFEIVDSKNFKQWALSLK